MRLKRPSIHQRVRVAPAALTATVGGEVVCALIEIPKPKSQIPNPKKSQTWDFPHADIVASADASLYVSSTGLFDSTARSAAWETRITRRALSGGGGGRFA